MSGKLSTKNIKTGGDNISKTLEPGTNICKINNVTLEEFAYKPGSYNIILNLEGEALENFEGFYIDKDRPELGRHLGQVGKVRASEWAFADGETKSGIAISRDMEMLKFLKQLCTAIDCLDWLDSQDDKHETIESFFKAFSKDKPYQDAFFNFVIAGKEYKNKGGYTAYDLYLPKFSKDGNPVEKENVSPSKLLKFNVDTHIKRLKVDNVSEFGTPSSESDIISNNGAAEFDL